MDLVACQKIKTLQYTHTKREKKTNPLFYGKLNILLYELFLIFSSSKFRNCDGNVEMDRRMHGKQDMQKEKRMRHK